MTAGQARWAAQQQAPAGSGPLCDGACLGHADELGVADAEGGGVVGASGKHVHAAHRLTPGHLVLSAPAPAPSPICKNLGVGHTRYGTPAPGRHGRASMLHTWGS